MERLKFFIKKLQKFDLTISIPVKKVYVYYYDVMAIVYMYYVKLNPLLLNHLLRAFTYTLEFVECRSDKHLALCHFVTYALARNQF